MKKHRLFFVCLILISIQIMGCGSQVENWVRSAPRDPASPGDHDTDDTPPIPAAPGYAFSSAGGTITGSTYKLRFRLGKLENAESLSGSTYKIRTGKTRHLKDM